jgi:hypothetical protein
MLALSLAGISPEEGLGIPKEIGTTECMYLTVLEGHSQYFTKRLEHGLVGSDKGDQTPCPSLQSRLPEQFVPSKC